MPFSRPIIILEDDAEDQEFLKEIITQLGIINPLKMFSSALAAMDYFVSAALMPLVIICDINLPEMTGIEFKKEINKNAFLSSMAIPFVFLTTNPDVKMIAQAYQLNIQGYFIKPGTLNQLKELVNAIVQYSRFCARPAE